MQQNKICRYGSRADRERNRIPENIEVIIRYSGQPPVMRQIDGKYRFNFTDSALEIVDTAGAGVVETMPLGLIRMFEASAA